VEIGKRAGKRVNYRGNQFLKKSRIISLPLKSRHTLPAIAFGRYWEPPGIQVPGSGALIPLVIIREVFGDGRGRFIVAPAGNRESVERKSYLFNRP